MIPCHNCNNKKKSSKFAVGIKKSDAILNFASSFLTLKGKRNVLCVWERENENNGPKTSVTITTIEYSN